MFEGTSDDAFEMVLTTTLKGLQDIDKGAVSNKKFAESQAQVTEAIKSAAGPYERLARAQKELAAAQPGGAGTDRLKDLTILHDRAAAAVHKIEGRTSGSSMPFGPAPTPYSVGPRGRLKTLQDQLHNAQTRGEDGSTIDDLAHLTRKAYDRANPTAKPEKPQRPEATTWSKIKGVLMSSRFGGPGGSGMGGLMPLVGQTMKAGLGPYFVVAEAAMAAGKALNEMSDQARESAHKFQDAMSASNGDPRSAAQASVLESLGGMGPNAAERMYAASRGGDPAGTYWNQRIGGSFMPDVPGSPVDKNAEMYQNIIKLRSMKKSGELSDPNEYQALRSLGVPDARQLVDMNDNDWAKSQRMIDLTKLQNGNGSQSNSDHYDFLERFHEKAKDTDTRGPGNIVRWFENTPFGYGLTKGISGSDQEFESTEKSAHMARDFMKKMGGGSTPGLIKGGFGSSIDIFSLLMPSGSTAQPSRYRGGNSVSSGSISNNSGDPLSAAILLLVATLKNGGMVGGGDRARSAMPDRIPSYAVPGQYTLAQAVNDKALRLSSL